MKKIDFLLGAFIVFTLTVMSCNDNGSPVKPGVGTEDGPSKMLDLSVCGNFSLEIEVSKETANVGDAITVTATLLNLSGEAVEIEFIPRYVYTSATGYNMIHLSVDFDGQIPANDAKVESVKTNIAKNGALTRTIEVLSLNYVGEYHVWAEAIFFTDKNSNKPIILRIDSIRIQVK